mmetsp:Transcript_150489/g.419305  ORF Transcript_150489/g.419305 Transcript_150489/m.419305 type:complete len:206 (-) Transcript_150489:424-1041(-)
MWDQRLASGVPDLAVQGHDHVVGKEGQHQCELHGQPQPPQHLPAILLWTTNACRHVAHGRGVHKATRDEELAHADDGEPLVRLPRRGCVAWPGKEVQWVQSQSDHADDQAGEEPVELVATQSVSALVDARVHDQQASERDAEEEWRAHFEGPCVHPQALAKEDAGGEPEGELRRAEHRVEGCVPSALTHPPGDSWIGGAIDLEGT